MIIVFNCPHCAAILRMKEQYGGQRGRCPHCQGEITVPAIESDAGMDLIPLAGAPPVPAETAPAPAASPPLFSIESRLRSLAGAAATDPPAGAAKPSDSGDSNIGLAPVDDSPAAAKASALAASQSSALDSPPRAAKPSGPSDSTIGLAPVDDGPTHAVKTPPPPPPPPRPASSDDDDDNFGLAPLDEVATKPASRAATPVQSTGAQASSAQGSAAAVSDSNADVRLTVVCDGCGARMRVPPTSAGRQLTCPRCKKKMRVPEAAVATASSSAGSSASDTRAPRDTSASSSGNLDIGMLDELDAANQAGADEKSAAPLRAANAKGKGKAKAKGSPLGRANRNTLLGMSPMVVYSSAAGVGLLIAGLATVYFATRPAPTPTPTAVSQAPSSTTPSSPSPAPTTGAPQPKTPGAPAPTAPTPGASPTPPTTTPAPSTPMPVLPPAPPGRAEWRNRIPVVRMSNRRFASEQKPEELGGADVPLLTVPPIEPRPPDPTPEEIKTFGKAAAQLAQTQQPIFDQLKQMIDGPSIKQHAIPWAELTAQGLEQIRQDGRLDGIPLPNSISGDRFNAKTTEEKIVVQIQTELERLAQLPGAIDSLALALKERAAREPSGALAATLKQAQP